MDAAPGRARLPPRKVQPAGESLAAGVAPPAIGVAPPAAGAAFPVAANRAIVFVDVDGVLNGNGQPDDADCFWPEGHESAMRDNYLVLSRLRLDRFARMVTAHDLDIVLSTSWRLDATARAALLAAFSAVGIGARVLGDTPDLSQSSEGLYPGGVRGDEIRAWLEQLVGRRPAWVAIDDMPMATAEAEAHRPTPLMPGHLVCTDGGVGLSEADAERAGALLAEQRSAEG